MSPNRTGRPAWGLRVGKKDMGAYALRVFEPRPQGLADILNESEKWGAREFLVHGARRASFAEFHAAVARAAARLAGAGVRRGDRVMLLGANSAEWLVGFWALARIGAVIALANAWWSAEETAHALALVEPCLVLVDNARSRNVPADHPFIAIEALIADWAAGSGGGPPATATYAPGVEVDEESPALFIFTSGTTSRAKAAVLSHRAALACLHVLYAGRGVSPAAFGPEDAQTTMLSCAPLFHLSGYMSHTQALLSGHRFVLLEGRADPERILDLIENERVQTWASVPTLLSRVVHAPSAMSRDLSMVTGIAGGGAAVSTELMDRVRRVFPNARIGASATYGLTEAGGSVTLISGEEYLRRPLSCGRALPACELRIEAPDAEGEGEILVRTPSQMSGYWGETEGRTLDREGWIHTGDLGRLDEEGYLYITGRAKDIVIRGGENVSAPHVEHCLSRHAGVLEVAVVGLPHPDLVEEVAAAVVPKKGAALDIESLAAVAAESLAYFERPTRWWIRDEPLPTNATSKVVKAQIVAEWPD